jgi:hypothetical protein
VYGVMTILIDSADISRTHFGSIVSECGVSAAVAGVCRATVDVAVGFDTGESLANGYGEGDESDQRSHG